MSATANVMAVAAVANIVKSSLGPVGLDKVLLESCNIRNHTPDHEREVSKGYSAK